MTIADHDEDYECGHQLLQNLIRGDALIGLVPDLDATQKKMMQALRSAAIAGHAAAYHDMGECYAAVLVPMGAFDGVYDPDQPAWSDDAALIVDDNPALQAALRCYFVSARLGHRASALAYCRWTRHANAANQIRGAALLAGLPMPTDVELCQLGYVQNWIGELALSAATLQRAADAGSTDAQFELYIYYAQGLGVAANSQTSHAWLQRAADGKHGRALFNLGAACAAGGPGTDGTPNFVKAAEFYRRATQAGNGRAAAMLGVMILNLELAGTQANAIEWFDLSDTLGYATWELLEAAGLDDPRGGDASGGQPW